MTFGPKHAPRAGLRSVFLATTTLVLVAAGLTACGGSSPGKPRHTPPRVVAHPPRPRIHKPSLSVVASFPDTTTNIHLGLAFDYSASRIGDPLANDVDYIFGGYLADWNFGFYPPVRHVDAYLPFDTDAFPQTIPGHSLADWQASHPDWIVYQCDRKTPAYFGSGQTNVPLDFSNPAVRAWQVQQAAALFARGASGVAFDDFTFANYANRCGVYRNGVWTPLGYPGRWQANAKLDNDMITWLTDVRAQLHQRYPTKTLTLSYAPSLSGLAHLEQISPYLDMDFDEGGFTYWGGHDLSDTAWQQEVDALEYLNAQGKAVDVNGIVKASDDASVTHAELNWVLANYLLVKGPFSYTYVYAGNGAGYTNSPSGYGTFYDRPEYHIPIGAPTSPRYQSQGVQMRNYSGGLAIVNPSGSQTETVGLDRPYTNMWGQRYTSLTMAPTTAIVLLNGQG